MYHENEFITDLKKKAELSNLLFAKQGPLLRNDSKLYPKRLSTIKFSCDVIFHYDSKVRFTQSTLSLHDDMIKMLKFCRELFVDLWNLFSINAYQMGFSNQTGKRVT